MSHEIKALVNNKHVSSLQFSRGNQCKKTYLYVSLKAEGLNNGDSGNGESKDFSLTDIVKARDELFEIMFNDYREVLIEDGVLPVQVYSEGEEDECYEEVFDFYTTLIKSGYSKFRFEFL